jgi:CheY-like chemotaxis protein
LVQHSRDELLRREGYRVTSTSDIREALNSVAKTRFDLVLLCHSLDDGDRKKLVALVKETTPQTPVVILYAGLEPKRASSLHARSDPQSMLETVGNVLGTHPRLDRAAPFAYRILVVDDNPSIRDAAAAILETQAYEVHTAQDGIAALKALGGSLPDVVITDLRMSNMGGFELLAVIRKRFPQIATIAMSDELAPGTQPNALLADAFLEKGAYSPEKLFHKILDLLKKSPLRSSGAKPPFAPIWIARMDGAGKSLLTCTSCLRSSPVALSGVTNGVHQHLCPSCGDHVSFEVHAGTRQQWLSASRPSRSMQ